MRGQQKNGLWKLGASCKYIRHKKDFILIKNYFVRIALLKSEMSLTKKISKREKGELFHILKNIK